MNPFQANKAAALAFDPLPHMIEYLEEKRAEGKHPKYIQGVRNALAHFAASMKPLGVHTQYDIERRHLIQYQGWVNQQDWAKSYRIELLKRVRAWLNWLVDIGYLDDTPWVRIRLGKVEKIPKPLSDDDLDRLFAAHRRGAISMSPFAFHRREMILCLLYGWGLRIHELTDLDMSNMDVRQDFVAARNKGGGSKTLPYLPEMKKAFLRWGQVRTRYAMPMNDALIITRGGDRMPEGQIYKIITDLGSEAAVSINPHRLRDTCATNLLDDGVELERVRQILGHTNLRQTLQYANVNNRLVLEAANRSMDPRLNRLFSRTASLTATAT